MVPVANLGARFGLPLAIIGSMSGSTAMVQIGTLGYAGAILLTFLTLPVEFNASKRALQLLRSYQLADGRELQEAKQVLDAASLTYIAALAQAISTMLYYVFLLTGFSRRD